MVNHNLPIIALVGPPNSGKSTLLNKIAGKPLAVTSDIAGTTRDRQYLDVSWNGSTFTLVDTAGLSFETRSELEENIQKQIQIATQEADGIIFLADGKEPAAALDIKVLKKFRNLKKPIALAVNKMDSAKNLEEKLSAFAKFGIKKMFAVSAITGRGIGDLLDYISSSLPDREMPSATDDISLPLPKIAVSIVGKPNVGKSSIFNAILKQERAVVSSLPGTTRTAIDSEININGIDYIFIDTAGLKKKEYRQEQPDIYSGFQVFKSIRRGDISFFVIDANEEITKQDQRIAQEIFKMEKGCIILANKIDIYSKSNIKFGEQGGSRDSRKNTDDKYNTLRDYISHHFPFLWMCPAFFVSAKTSEGLEEALGAIKPIFEARNKKIDNQTLSEFLSKKLKTNPPKLLRDQKKPKVFSLHQVDINPPKFELLVNHPAAISMQFRKFLENSIIRDLGFWGTPIVFKLVGKDKA
ncbi:MAG: ribosome biogenesis GTPase Der [Candidatus Doudnabacteria bacterium]|nr:ribosome biogenesis GTPase Der [Candidatus Doudnabacteria bacterium]